MGDYFGRAGHCFDIDNFLWHEPGRCRGSVDNCDGRCCGIVYHEPVALTLTIGQGATSERLEVQLIDRDNTAPDLTLATSVVFRVQLADRSRRAFSTAADPVRSDLRAGFVSHTFTADETFLPGLLVVDVMVTDTDGVRFYPTDASYWEVLVTPKIG